MSIDESLIQEIVQRILSVACPKRIILFGSAATAEMSRDSDIDLLVVEDDPSSYILICKLLQPLNYQIIHTKDGEEAVNVVRDHPHIDLILMDLKLPHLDGYSATKAIKKMHPEIPVIAQTAYAMPGDREKALKAGCDEYLTKPLDTRKLLDIIAGYLTDKKDTP